ncbi:MAG: hypothetical protein KKH34_09690 [Candidatus Omnitrophica bacterium]|nr:hypothetical protein [Candidatus Omnitrophota bacterium]
MKKDKFKTIFFMTIIALNMAVRVFCFPADVHDLSGPKYFPAVKEAISKGIRDVDTNMQNLIPSKRPETIFLWTTIYPVRGQSSLTGFIR